VVAAPPTAGGTGSSLAGWLQYLVPLLGSGGSVAFLFAVPGPRSVWLVAAVAGVAVVSVALGLGLRLVERRAARRASRRQRDRYLAYLARVATEAGHRAAAQLAAAEHLHPDLPRLWALVNRTDRLWERRPTDDDFLTVRIGRGPVPLATRMRLDTAAGPLAEHDPELLEAAEELVSRAQRLPDAPVAVALRQLGVLAVTGPPERARSLGRSMICQLAALHAPDDLQILAAVPADSLPHWDWLKWLPHARDPTPVQQGDPPGCLVATTPAELAELLTRQVRPRLAAARADRAHSGPAGPRRPAGPRPHLVVVLDTTPPDDGSGRAPVPGGLPPRAAFRPAVVEELQERAAAAGVTVVCLAGDTAGEPSKLAARIRLDGDGWAVFEETAPGGCRITGIHADTGGFSFCETIARRLAPLRLDRRPAAARTGPVRLLDLLDLLDLGTDPIDPTTARRPRPRSGLLRVPVGRAPDGEPLVLDLKEAAEGGIGPHGLVVGATGSGKSELLRTTVAGLAATHPPDQLAFVLVDFKGGAAFSDLAPLPHVAGLITNLQADLSMVDRALAAFQGEQARRQRLLHLAGNQPDLRAYAARRRRDPRLELLPHLLIVVDEFGELLAARPEFLDLFIAIGRVGRSLGMHLLLASQRLDEGRLHGLDGHLRYRICLRTFSAVESVAVLGVPDAYHLPPAPGGALLKVDAGPPLPFVAALVSATRRQHPTLATATSNPHEAIQAPRGPVDAGHRGTRSGPGGGRAVSGVRIVPFGVTRPAGPPPPEPDPNPGVDPAGLDPAGVALAGSGSSGPDHPGPAEAGPSTDLDALVDQLSGAGRRAHQVWLPPLAATIPLDGLLQAVGPGWLRVPVGTVDRPVEQVQEPLVLDLSGAAGHLAVVGAPRTGKSTLLCTIVAALSATHSPDELQLYGIDLGGGLLHRLDDLPHVGAVCGPREPERVHRLVRELRSLVVERERRFRDLGVDSMASWHELRRAGLDLGEYGEVVLVVDNWGALARECPDLEAEIAELAAVGLHHGVHLVLAANRWAELRPGLRDNLGGRLELRINDPLESDVGRAPAGALPKLPGRGLTPAGLQFQAALPGPSQAVLDRAMTSPDGAVAPPLRLLPALVGERALPGPGPGQPAGFPFAVEEHRLELVWLDLFQGPPHLLVLGDPECGKTSVLRLIAHGLAARYRPQDLAILVVDLRRDLLDLTALPHLAGYACTAPTIVEAVDQLQARLTTPTGSSPDLDPPAVADRTPSSGVDHPPHPPGPVHTALSSDPALPERSMAGSPPTLAPLVSTRPPGVGGAAVRRGPRYVVLVDDYDLLPAATGSPLLPLLDLLGQGRELGLHLVLARGVAGSARAGFEPFFQRLRELGGSGLIMSGDPGEGPLLAGQQAAPLPAGRGYLVRPRRPATLVQVAYSPPPTPSGPKGRAAPDRAGKPACRLAAGARPEVG
jgi:S-DNA-T family DNA segregation ATPase FtsK/SpoIIIE